MPIEILPGLWLSNKFDNFNQNFLKIKNINCIFSTKMIKTNYEIKYVDIIRILLISIKK